MKKTLVLLLLSSSLATYAATNIADSSKYIIPISGPGITITNPHTDYKVDHGTDNGEKIELDVSVLNMHTYKENADFSEANKIYENGSKTVFSYKNNIYTDKYIKYTSKSAIDTTSKNLKQLYCAADEFHPPSSQQRLFQDARKENKKITINYYSDSGETLMFGIGISPESCN